MKRRAELLGGAVLLSLIAGCAGAPSGAGMPGAGAPEDTSHKKTALELLRSSEGEQVWGTGWAVAISGDGSEYVLTRPYIRDPMAGDYGNASIYAGNREVHDHALILEDERLATGLYGYSAAVSPDKSLVLLGAPGYAPKAPGAVYFYGRPAEGWKDAKTDPFLFSIPGAPGAGFGSALALSGASGTTVVVGAPSEGIGGQAVCFFRPPKGWAEPKSGLQAKTLGIGNPRPGDRFGVSVAISRDDGIIVVGAPGRDGGKGAVYVFRKPKAGWMEVTDLIPIQLPEGAAGDRFGEAVAISDNGKLIVVGAPGADGGVGSVRVIRTDSLDGGKLTLERLAVNTEHRGFGIAVDVSTDGSIIAVGSLGTELRGAVRAYRSESRTWSDGILLGEWIQRVDLPAAERSLFGFSLDLSDAGDLLLIGKPGFDKGRGGHELLDLTR